MTFKEMVDKQELTDTETAYVEHICKQWERFSNTVGKMNKGEVIKVLKYLVLKRPNSKTFGERAIQRFNTLNKVTWEGLINGDRKTSRSIPEEES